MEAAGVLSVAFGLGLLLHASQAAFYTAINGHIQTLFLHRRRLVLLSFLLCVSVFSVTQFATLLLLDDGPCSVLVRFTLFFDQAARVSALALVVWKVCDEAGARAEAVVWVGVVVLRILMGGIVVGFTGMVFMPVCFPSAMHGVVGIVQIAVDGSIWAVLAWRIVGIWMLFVEQGRGGRGGKSMGYGLFLTVLGFIGWTIGSFPFMINVGDSIFIRMIPYILTLTLALGVLSCFPSIVFSAPPSKSPDYKLHQFRLPSRSGSAPASNVSDMEANKYTFGTYTAARNSQMFRSIIGAPIVHPGTAIPWSLDVPENVTRPKPSKAAENRRPSVAHSHTGKASISGPIGPIMRNASFDAGEGVEIPTSNPFGKVKTVDLKTAAEAERQRIDAAYEREERKKAAEAATPGTADSGRVTGGEYRGMERSTSVKRKPLIPQLPPGPAAYRVSVVGGLRGAPEFDSPASLRQSVLAAATEGSDWGMRYSTRANSISTEDDDTTRYTTVSHAPYVLAAPPRIPQLEGIEGNAKVMFVNEIVYNDPALVKSIMGKTDVVLTTSRYSQSTATTIRRSPSSATKRIPGILTPTRELEESSNSSNSTPVMDRPRTVGRVLERGIFPPNRDSELAAEMQYKKKAMERASNLLLVPTTTISPPPVQQVTKKQSRELVFPVPPIRAPSLRKSAPPPITITVPKNLSPEIFQDTSKFDTDQSPPAIPVKSEKRTTLTLSKTAVLDNDTNVSAYDTAKAWIDSVSAITVISPSLYSGTIDPLPATAYEPERTIENFNVSSFTADALLRRSLISLTTSPLTKPDDDGDFTDIEIDSEDEYGDEQADDMLTNGNAGYSTEDGAYESDYFTSSEEEEYADDDDVVIADGTTYDHKYLDAFPRHFQPGDRIPTFSEKYGSRRKPPPSPIGFLMRQRHEQIQNRLTMLAATQNGGGLNELMKRLPRESYNSDGGNSLLARLEKEMGQQESQWMGMRLDLGRVSGVSSVDSSVQMLARLSRRSLLARISSGVDRRLSNAQAKNSSPPPSAKWKELADAQMEYLVQAPSFSRREGESPLKPMSILESQHTPVSVVSGSDLGIHERESIYGNDNLDFILEGNVYEVEDSKDEYEEGEEDDEEYYSDGEDYYSEEDIQPLQATVYCPSIRSASIRSISIRPDSPLQTYYSSTTESFSPSLKSPRSLLWNLHTPQEAPKPSKLWSHGSHQLYPSSSLFPPALSLRRKPRTSTAPLPILTSGLWTKAQHPLSAPITGLWSSPIQFRPKSIPKTRRSLKRVTFVEDVITVEPTGFFGKLKKLWGAPKKQAPTIPPIPDALKIQAVAAKYAHKKLPPLPVGKALWTRQADNELASSSTTTLWSAATASSTGQEKIFVKDASELRMKPRASVLTALEPSSLWTPGTAMLWTPQTQSSYLWPTGMGSVTRGHLWPSTASLPSVLHQTLPSRKTSPCPLAQLESTDLWKQGVPACITQQPTGLWSRHATTRKIDCLWPSASALPTSYLDLAADVRPSRRPASTLAALESRELWKAMMVVAVLGLWTPSVKSSSLWPTGAHPKTETTLWPSAPALRVSTDACVVRTRSRTITLPVLVSATLWNQNSKAALWATPTQNSVLWPTGEISNVITHLWPSAVPLEVGTEASVVVRFRSPLVTLPSLTSTTLWGQKGEKPALWTPLTKRSLLWPSGEATRAFTRLWPSAAALDVVEQAPVRARSSLITLQPITSATLWHKGSANPALWKPSAKKGLLWPTGESKKATTTLWPSAPSQATITSAPVVRSRSSDITLPVLESSALWAYQEELVEEWSGLWGQSAIRNATASLLSRPEAEAEAAIIGLWVKPQVQVTITGGWLSPSAMQLPERVYTPSTTTRSHTSKALPAIQSTALWCAKPYQKTTLWSPALSHSALWPNGESTEVSALWPSASSLPECLYISSTSRSRTSTTLLSIRSTALWSSKQAPRVTLWTLPIKQAALWPHGKLVDVSALWPSAAQLPECLYTPSTTSRSRASKTLPSILSAALWSSKPANQASLWCPSAKQAALWPHGKSTDASALWPSAPPLPTHTYTPHTSAQSHPTSPLPIHSAALWSSQPVHQVTLWCPAPPQSALWPHGSSAPISALWPSAAPLPVSQFRSRIGAKPRLWAAPVIGFPGRSAVWTGSELWSAGSKGAVRPLDGWLWQSADMLAVVHNPNQLWTGVKPALWDSPEEGGLWNVGGGGGGGGGGDQIVRRANLTLVMEIDGERVVRKKNPVSVASAVSGALWRRPEESRAEMPMWLTRKQVESQQISMLWAEPSVLETRATSALWPVAPSISTPTSTSTQTARARSSAPVRAATSSLEPARGHLWGPSPLADTADSCTGAQGGLWSTDGTPAALAHIGQQKLPSLALQWAGSLELEPATATASSRGLGNLPPRPAQVLNDKPVIAAPIPTGASRSVNKRGSTANSNLPPLFLAQPHRDGPREPTRPISGTTTAGRTSPNTDKIPAQKSAKELKTKLFPHISTQAARTPTISMEGPLWTAPSPAKQELWRKKEQAALNGAAVTPAPTAHLWGENPDATAPIFAELSLESSRSRHEFVTKSFSAPPEGLWKKQARKAVIEPPTTGLWGVMKEPTIVSEPAAISPLWQKDSTAAPMFAGLPAESYRSKKDHSTVTLPVFSEGMWKKRVALPEKPELWKPTPKSTYLWDSNSRTKTLAQILLERKAKAIKKPLWTKCQASRTTAKLPQRSPVVLRISNDTTLPKATGSLWTPKTAKKQPPQLWTAPKPVVKTPKSPKSPLWTKEKASRTTAAVPERTKVAFIPSHDPLPIVSGTLWKPKSSTEKITLWKRPIKTVATYRRTSVSVPLWSKELAARTTTAHPEPHTFIPKKKDSNYVLPKVSGALWQPKTPPAPGLWKAPVKRTGARPRSASLLWAKHTASRTTTATPVRTTVPKRLADEPLAVVAGTLWKPASPTEKVGLWKRPIKTVATYRRISVPTLLWAKETASRTTTARPDRTPFVPKPQKTDTLPPAKGSLWKPAEPTPPLSLWAAKSSSAGSGVWDAEGHTPSLAEFALRKDTLWQRRSVLTSAAASSENLAAAPKNIKIVDAPGLWRPVSPVIQNEVCWIRSSSVGEESFVSPNLSRASTISDVSECEFSPPSTGEDDFEPGIARIHSTKASISSTAGEALWGKKESTWASEEGRGVPRSSGDKVKEAELKMFDKSHSLWRPSGETEEKPVWVMTRCDSSGSEDFHDAESHDADAESDFHDATSQISESSHYQDPDFVPHPESTLSTQSHVVVGQFRRDNYLPHTHTAENLLPENSPFASSLRIGSLKRKLRPVKSEVTEEADEMPVPSGLWSK